MPTGIVYVAGWSVNSIGDHAGARRRSDGHAGRPAGAERRRRCGCAGDAKPHGSGSPTRRSRSSAAPATHDDGCPAW